MLTSLNYLKTKNMSSALSTTIERRRYACPFLFKLEKRVLTWNV